ncbi:DNA/RNA helicase domain-containing protein [Streptomyces gardneri]|uniref:DNA/RNA helicase domain-containing protein n=1 Tax=Streptomyces gardneri TaxID=66892 RepID=UPI0036977323
MLLRKSAADLKPMTARLGGENSHLTALLIERYRKRHQGRRNPDPDAGLIASWNNSLPNVIDALVGCGRGTAEVMLEFDMPGMDSSADVVLAGEHPVTGDLSYVVVELKQWDMARVSPDNPVAVQTGHRGWKLHPVRQVQRYCDYLIQHLAPLHDHSQRIAGAALLHNARSEVRELFSLAESLHGRLYTADSLDLFQAFLANRLSPAPGGRAADVLANADVYEPPSSSEAFSRAGSPHPVFALQKEQEMAFQSIRNAVETARSAPRKRVIIVQGGPGSGKTALAVELLRTLRQEGREVVHASGSIAFTSNLRQAAIQSRGRGVRRATADRQAKRDYRFFNSFGKQEADSVPVLICDEAHRIRDRSHGRQVPKWVYKRGWPQADELIHAAEVPVFLLDDWQSIGPNEVGSTEYLIERAKALGCEVVVHDLPGMYRAGGSVKFRGWVSELLSLKAATPRSWESDGRIDVRLADSPLEMETFLERCIQQKLGDARIMAGFCWEWAQPRDGLRLEVQIDTWHKPWNARTPAPDSGAPPTSEWATDPQGFGQVGCIYTAQNFEFDWSGVIIGPDLVWRDGTFVVDRTKTHDSELKKEKVTDAQVYRSVRNAYHVLLTRARRGVVIYTHDEETRNKLRELIPGTVADSPLTSFPRRKKKPGANRYATARGARLTPRKAPVWEQDEIAFD